MLKMPISRPRTVTVLDVPVATSLALATTWRVTAGTRRVGKSARDLVPSRRRVVRVCPPYASPHESRQPVQGLGVVADHVALLPLGRLELEDVLRMVEVPMRIVGREHHAVPADPCDHL